METDKDSSTELPAFVFICTTNVSTPRQSADDTQGVKKEVVDMSRKAQTFWGTFNQGIIWSSFLKICHVSAP